MIDSLPQLSYPLLPPIISKPKLKKKAPLYSAACVSYSMLYFIWVMWLTHVRTNAARRSLSKIQIFRIWKKVHEKSTNFR